MDTTVTASDWLQASYYIMDLSMSIGAKIYPFLFAIGILRMLVYCL